MATVLGAFLVTLALLLRLWVPGHVIKFPLNEYSVTTLTGNHITYFSSTSLREYRGVTVTDIATIEGNVAAGSSSTAVWDSFTALEDNTHGVVISHVSRVTAFNRRTGVLVNCCGATAGANRQVVQSGQGFRWPFGAEGQTYQVFDATLLRPAPFAYAGTGTIDGMAADKFVEHVVNRRFGQQTLPGPLVGMKHQATVTLPEYLTATNTYWVDPVTGTVLDTKLDQRVTLKDAAGVTRLTLLAGRLAETPRSVRAAVASAGLPHSMIEWMEELGPLIGLVVGIAALAAGIAVIWRSQEAVVPAYDDDEVVDLTGELGGKR
jgi:Porin PorA